MQEPGRQWCGTGRGRRDGERRTARKHSQGRRDAELRAGHHLAVVRFPVGTAGAAIVGRHAHGGGSHIRRRHFNHHVAGLNGRHAQARGDGDRNEQGKETSGRPAHGANLARGDPLHNVGAFWKCGLGALWRACSTWIGRSGRIRSSGQDLRAAWTVQAESRRITERPLPSLPICPRVLEGSESFLPPRNAPQVRSVLFVRDSRDPHPVQNGFQSCV